MWGDSIDIPARPRPPMWFACEHPERPPDEHTTWHLVECHGCRVACEAAFRRDPTDNGYAMILEFMAHPPEGAHWMNLL